MAINVVHILILGATGPSGIAFVEEAINTGHQLTIYARNPSKLPEPVRNSARVAIIQGTFEDWDAVNTALHCGATVLVSFAGPKIPNAGTPVTKFYERFFPMMVQDGSCSIKRCLCCTTPSFSVLQDKPSWKWWLLVLSVKWVGGSAYSEVNGIGRVVSGLPLDKLEWTLFRVPVLTHGGAKPVRAGLIGEAGDGIMLSRKSIAVWVLQELEQRKWIGQAPALSNHGWI